MVAGTPAPPPPIEGWEPGCLDRLKQVDLAFADMGHKERTAAFEWLRSKYGSDWPSERI